MKSVATWVLTAKPPDVVGSPHVEAKRLHQSSHILDVGLEDILRRRPPLEELQQKVDGLPTAGPKSYQV
jgi:hypothetical protein